MQRTEIKGVIALRNCKPDRFASLAILPAVPTGRHCVFGPAWGWCFSGNRWGV